MAVATIATNRNRVMEEAGKGVEALRHQELAFTHLTTTQTFVGVIGPFDVDVDIVEAALTVGLAITDNAANIITIFNGTVAGAVVAAYLNFNTPTTPTLQVPMNIPLLTASAAAGTVRVKAGTPIRVQFVFGGTDTIATATVALGLEIPLMDPSAKIQTFQAYNFAGAH